MDSFKAGAAARETEKAATSPDGASPSALHKLALGHLQAGRQLDAQLCCERALALDPDYSDSLHLMGLLALQARQFDHAIEWLTRAGRQNPGSDDLVGVGMALTQQGLREEAFRAFDAAVKIKPDDPERWLHHGNALVALGRSAEALASYQQALTLNPNHANVAFHRGMLLRDLKRFDEALSCFDLCDRLLPDNVMVLEQRGLMLHALKRYEEALAVNLRAQAQRPASAELCNNIGAALLKLGRYDESLPWFDKALALMPGSITVLISKAAALAKMLRLEEALAIYAQAQAIDPGNADIGFLVSELRLLRGDFDAGWAARKVRWKARLRDGFPDFGRPIWLGDGPVAGKTVLVYADEGLGDSIQFARYIPMLAARGARVILAVDAPLLPLLSGLTGVTQLVDKSATLPAFDLHCPICSLPLAFRTRLETIPAGSYLPPPASARLQVWEQRLLQRFGPRARLRVGLAWAGRAEHANDQNRSMRLQTLASLLDLDADFVSLQQDQRPDDAALLAQTNILDLTAQLTDLAETAALMSCLDLVVTVDTSIAHLAGALGRPTWIMLPHAPDWRWLLDRDDSPWYPTVRLFRQRASGGYEDVVARVRAELLARISTADAAP